MNEGKFKINTKLVALGIVLLIMGIAFYIFGIAMIESVKQYNVYGIPIHEFLIQISYDLKMQYDIGNILFYLGIILGIVGFGMFVGGLIPKRSMTDKIEKKPIQEKETKKDDEVLKTLKMRYAKGEITKEEFEEMKKDIKG